MGSDDTSSSRSSSSSSSSSSPLLHDVMGSATAGIISRIVTHPLDTAKARIQAPVTSIGGRPNETFRGPLDALVRTYRHEGPRALYGGFGAVIVGGTPGTVLYLTGYAFFRDSLSSAASGWRGREATASSAGDTPTPSHPQEFAIHFMSGMLAEAVSCVVYVPVDVVKERMQVQRNLTDVTGHYRHQNHQYNGSLDALRQILRTEGMRGIYKGYGATLASFGPFSALYFMFYEQCKTWSKEYVHRKDSNTDAMSDDGMISVKDGDLPFIHLVACSAGAGALASWLTSPLDMAKLRLQVQRGKSAAAATQGKQTVQYSSMLDCLRSAYVDGGLRGLFRGAGARVIHFAPATTITMTCYEKCRAFYADSLG
ncbi:hypothetical protein ACHAXA_007758 [Cyclostephanos tholiformis]|uniref:Mitochondrial carrier protein n=1 Tax=Cyclostephanos tholiformis TaxID=382380 RepID=A0ABD3RAD9_9STRA